MSQLIQNKFELSNCESIKWTMKQTQLIYISWFISICLKKWKVRDNRKYMKISNQPANKLESRNKKLTSKSLKIFKNLKKFITKQYSQLLKKFILYTCYSYYCIFKYLIVSIQILHIKDQVVVQNKQNLIRTQILI